MRVGSYKICSSLFGQGMGIGLSPLQVSLSGRRGVPLTHMYNVADPHRVHFLATCSGTDTKIRL